jgi:hypothetical protein
MRITSDKPEIRLSRTRRCSFSEWLKPKGSQLDLSATLRWQLRTGAAESSVLHSSPKRNLHCKLVVISNIDDRDTQGTILVNPSPDLRHWEGRTEVPLMAFHDKDMHEKEFFIPLMHGGEGKLKVQFQIVHGPLEYYQSLARGYEEAAYDLQDTTANFRDMLEAMYRPFPGLSSEKNRLLSNIRPADSVLGGSKPSRPFPAELSSVGPGFQSYNPYSNQNRSKYVLLTSYFNNTSQSPSQLMKPELRDTPGYIEPQARGLPQELSAFSTKTDNRRRQG